MTRLLAEMTWEEVERAVAAGATTVILPLGATEQHGPHLPVGTDTYLAMAQAEQLSAHITDALIAPVIPIGCSDEHAGFAGLLGLGHETLASVVVDCAKRMAGWGVRRLILLSAHGGNGEALALAAARLEELPCLHVLICGSSTALSDPLLALAEADGVPPEAVGLHAGEGETSQMLCLRPDLVHMDRVAPGYMGLMEEVMPALRKSGLRPVTPNGVLGDARRADGSRGARYMAGQIESYRHHLCPPVRDGDKAQRA
jgi:creatinine amidohydrolase